MNSKKPDNSSVLLGIENSAISLLGKAVEHDNEGRHASALTCYQEGIQLFLDVIKSTADPQKQKVLREKAALYMSRAERIKGIVQKQKDSGSYHEQVHIPDDCVGFSYESIFSKYCDKSVTLVEVEDPYIRNTHQLYNFLAFCEVLVRFCGKSLKRVHLTTGVNEQEQSHQRSKLQSISESLAGHGVELTVQYSSTLHDREIRFDNGWIVKVGRGLDFFKPTNKFSLGFSDQHLRRCHETTVDIYFKNK